MALIVYSVKFRMVQQFENIIVSYQFLKNKTALFNSEFIIIVIKATNNKSVNVQI